MIQIIIAIIVFISVLFFYLHIIFHLKTSNDLEMYEIEYPSKDRLEELCDMRQPILLKFTNNYLTQFTLKTNKSYLLNNYKNFDIKIRKLDFTNTQSPTYLTLPFEQASKLFKNDANQSYISENNHDFIIETGTDLEIKMNDVYFRPYMVSNLSYDILFGSLNSCTPLRYVVNYRNYIIVTQGSVRIKLTAPDNSKYLHPVYDYNNFEFRSEIHPWNPQPQFLSNYEKIKFLEFTLTSNQVLFVPAKWWYTIQFIDDASIVTLNYKTYMNNLAITPYYFLHWLQLLNTKTYLAKIYNVNTNKSSTDELQTKIVSIDKSDSTTE